MNWDFASEEYRANGQKLRRKVQTLDVFADSIYMALEQGGNEVFREVFYSLLRSRITDGGDFWNSFDNAARDAMNVGWYSYFCCRFWVIRFQRNSTAACA